jgi:hypothetical protein
MLTNHAIKEQYELQSVIFGDCSLREADRYFLVLVRDISPDTVILIKCPESEELG